MKTPLDLKSFGLPSHQHEMSDGLRWFVRGCVAVIFVGTAWGLTVDTPERQVVTITIPVEAYTAAIEAARFEAALEVVDALEPEPCPEPPPPMWRDLFREHPPIKRGPM